MAGASCLPCASRVLAAALEPPARPRPLVAATWSEAFSTDGREVVVEPDLAKLQARGLTFEQLAAWVRRRRLGEPLATFAKVEMRGRQGPQGAALGRMREVREHLSDGPGLGREMAREQLERRFGKGKRSQGERASYLVGTGPGALRKGKGRAPQA